MNKSKSISIYAVDFPVEIRTGHHSNHITSFAAWGSFPVSLQNHLESEVKHKCITLQ